MRDMEVRVTTEQAKSFEEKIRKEEKDQAEKERFECEKRVFEERLKVEFSTMKERYDKQVKKTISLEGEVKALKEQKEAAKQMAAEEKRRFE